MTRRRTSSPKRRRGPPTTSSSASDVEEAAERELREMVDETTAAHAEAEASAPRASRRKAAGAGEDLEQRRALDREIDRRQLAYFNATKGEAAGPAHAAWRLGDLPVRASAARRTLAKIAKAAARALELLEYPLLRGAGPELERVLHQLDNAARDGSTATSAVLLDLAELGEALAWYERQERRQARA